MLLLSWLGVACTRAPQQRFNLESVKVTGNSELDDEEIEEHIASRETPRFLGLFPGVIYDYETFNRFVLERDLQRVERLYRSRGYYQARARAAHVFRSGSKVRVEIVVGLVSLAAVANGVVRVRAGARLSEKTARRIALHEVEGHVRPRVNGQRLGGVFSAGSAHASQDEEGRAILLEERAGLLDAERRRELGRRYLAVESLRDGAEFWETVTLLGQSGATLAAAVELTSRVHRGGGLGREAIYLIGYQRVAVALARKPELEQVLRSGRVTLDAAEELLKGSIELDHDGNVV